MRYYNWKDVDGQLVLTIERIASENKHMKDELDMEEAIVKAVASGVLSCDPNFDWRDLEIQ